MNRDEIIRMAREADLIDDTYRSDWYVFQLERFAEFVAASEREACAKVCETHAPTTTPTWVSYAKAIRARGQ